MTKNKKCWLCGRDLTHLEIDEDWLNGMCVTCKVIDQRLRNELRFMKQ